MQPIKKRNVTFIYPSLSCLMQVKYETLIHRYTLFLLHYQFIKSAKCIYYAHCNIIKSWINEPTFPGSRNHNQNESRPNVSSRLKDYLILQNYCNKMQPNIFFPLNIIRAAFPRFALFMSFYITFLIAWFERIIILDLNYICNSYTRKRLWLLLILKHFICNCNLNV